jgi:hypothetical protein
VDCGRPYRHATRRLVVGRHHAHGNVAGVCHVHSHTALVREGVMPRPQHSKVGYCGREPFGGTSAQINQRLTSSIDAVR